MSDYTKIVPAVAALDRALESGLGAPLESCLPGGAAGVAAVIDELGGLVLDMALSPLSADEAATFAGWSGEDVLSQSLEGPLGRSAEVETRAGVKAEEARQLRGSLGEMVRVQEAARLFRQGAVSGARFVQGLMAYACLRLVEALEAGAGRSAAEQGQILAETAKLRARVRTLRDRQDTAMKKASAKLGPLAEAAEVAEATGRARGTVEEVGRGGRPPDEAVLEAAAMLTEDAPLEPPPPPERRRKGR